MGVWTTRDEKGVTEIKADSNSIWMRFLIIEGVLRGIEEEISKLVDAAPKPDMILDSLQDFIEEEQERFRNVERFMEKQPQEETQWFEAEIDTEIPKL